ncbi:MAG TPA: peptide chain release factor N(5)-glutamine methyltransferase [Planctomycetota bacterium]|nr:peptide chain release factor N(5)-glutamine methyltransferase [Planctomycetota bacterium]
MSERPSPDGGTWTIQALLQWTTRFFESKGIEGGRLDGELLLAHALGWKRIDLYAHYDHVPRGEALERFREWVRARGLRRVPARYLMGESEFFSLPLAVTPSVLIPRPETELLVERALELLAKDHEARVADLGTGSGAIAIAVAARRPLARVVATDVSGEALAVARANAGRHGLAERIEFRQGEWFAALEPGTRFDVLLSNPPYVATPDLEQAMPEVRDHEPRVALDGGPDGLRSLRVLIAGAPAWLGAGGWLVLEIGAGQAEAVLKLAKESEAYGTTRVTPDYQGIPRIASMQTKV